MSSRNGRQRDSRDSFWWLALGWLTVQSIMLYALLRQLTGRESKSDAPGPQVDQPPAESLTAAAGTQTELPRTSQPVGTPDPEEPEEDESAQRAEPEGRQEDQGGRLAPYWDVIGLTSVAVTIAGAAIFYAAGWVYEAHWYGYYGLEVSQLALLPAQVMVQGIPGILLLVIGISVSLICLAIGRALTRPAITVEGSDILIVAMGAYLVAFLLTLILGISLKSAGTGGMPWETAVSLLVGGVLLSVALIAANVHSQIRTTMAMLEGDPSKAPLRLYAQGQVLPLRLLNIQGFRDRLARVIGEDRILQMEEPNRGMLQYFERYYLPLAHNLSRTRQFWLGVVLLLFFLVSISASAILGEFDARRGARSLSGDWWLPMTFLSSKQPIETLSGYEYEGNTKGLAYGPFGLVYSTESTLFLTEWKDTKYFEKRPSLLVLSKREEQDLLLTAPTPTPTATPTATPLPPTGTAEATP